MNYRSFNSTRRQVSEIGLGTWQLGAGWGDVPEETARQTLRAAADAGVTFFDTADVYGNGRSERLIGAFLRETRLPIYVATKLGRAANPGWPANFTRPAVRQHTEESLRRLGVDCIDLTQLHCVPTEHLEKGEMFEALRELKKEGKIRDFGASVESDQQALLCMDQPGLASLQIIFNIFRQKPIATIFQRARQQQVALIVRLPLASGLLTGKLTRQSTFAPDDHRNYNRDGQQFNVGETFAGLPFERGVDLAEKVKAATPAGMTMTQMALRWCLDFPEVSVVIPGAKNPQQAKANAAASSCRALPAELHERLASLYQREVAAEIRGPY